MKRTNQSKHHTQKSNPFLTLGLGMATTGGIIGMLIGGMNKMAGLFREEDTPRKLAKDMMAGAVEGILEHFEWKMDELKRENERVVNNNADLIKDRDMFKEKYEELLKKKKEQK